MLNEDEADEQCLEFKKFFKIAIHDVYFKLAFIVIIIVGIITIHI